MSDSSTLIFPLRTALGPVSLPITIAKVMRLGDLVPIAIQLTDAVVAGAIEQKRADGEQLSCRAGCAACCRQVVSVSAPEAFHLADRVAALDPGPREELVGRFAAARAASEAAGLAPGFAALLGGSSTPEAGMMLASRYFRAHLDCPFLRDETCSIHPDRPLTCRNLNVTSPAEWCSTPGLGVLQKVPTPPQLSGPLARLTAKLTGRSTEYVPLLYALDYAEENAEIARREWDGMELFAALREAMRNKPA